MTSLIALLTAALLTSSPAMAQNIPYQNSGNRWVDDGPSFWDQSEFSDESRGQVQIWNIYPEQKQVTYWTRTKFSKRHVAYLNQTSPGWDKGIITPRKPLGPYLVDCKTQKISLVLFEEGWLEPVLNPVGENFPVGEGVCRLAGLWESD